MGTITWIDTTRGLPPRDIRVLVRVLRPYIFYDVAALCGNGDWDTGGHFYRHDSVTHWAHINARNREGRDCVLGIMEPETTEVESECCQEA